MTPQERRECKAQPLGGGQCELDEGHEGRHMRRFRTGTPFYWSDTSQRKLADKHGSRFD